MRNGRTLPGRMTSARNIPMESCLDSSSPCEVVSWSVASEASAGLVIIGEDGAVDNGDGEEDEAVAVVLVVAVVALVPLLVRRPFQYLSVKPATRPSGIPSRKLSTTSPARRSSGASI